MSREPMIVPASFCSRVLISNVPQLIVTDSVSTTARVGSPPRYSLKPPDSEFDASCIASRRKLIDSELAQDAADVAVEHPQIHGVLGLLLQLHERVGIAVVALALRQQPAEGAEEPDLVDA